MIFITGHHDTGKSTLAKYFIENNFLHVETGNIVRSLYKAENPEIKFEDWAKGKGQLFDDHIIEEVKKAQLLVVKENRQDVVITGNRQIEGVNKICEKMPPLEGKKHLIVYVEADPQILFVRHQGRPDRSIPGLTFESFSKNILGYDQEMGVEEIKKSADLIICNACQAELFFSCFTSKFKEFGYNLKPPFEGQDFCRARRI